MKFIVNSYGLIKVQACKRGELVIINGENKIVTLKKADIKRVIYMTPDTLLIQEVGRACQITSLGGAAFQTTELIKADLKRGL